MTRLTRFEWACIALVALGMAARLKVFLYDAVTFDSAAYIHMGASFAREGEFVFSWLDPAQYTRHFPPLHPLILAAAYKVAGASLAVTQVVAMLEALFLVVVVFLTTRDLYGRKAAFAVTAIAATFPALVERDAIMYSESLVAALFALTIWAIIKSLDEPKYIVLGGLFAGLSYLAKASMGPFFILAAAGGFAWRFYYVRWKVFTDRWYLLAGAIFALPVLGWAYRNVLRHGWPNWETQAHASEAMRHLFTQAPWPLILAQELLWTATILLVFALPWMREVRGSWREVRDQRVSALWLAVITPTVVAVFFVSAFFAYERYDVVTSGTNVRYLTAPIVPLLWLAARHLGIRDEPAPHGEPASGAPLVRRHRALLAAGAAVLFLAAALSPVILMFSLARLLLLFALLATGVTLLALAGASSWTSVAREAKGATGWRAVPDPAPQGMTALLFVGALVLAGVVWLSSLVYTIPAVAAWALKDPRERVVLVALLFAGAGFTGIEQRFPVEEVAAEINQLAPSEGGVGTGRATNYSWLYPYLREDVRFAPEDPDVAAEFLPVGGPPEPPPGYHTAARFPITFVEGPGTWALGKVERALGVGVELPVGDAYVYARNATG